MSLTPGQLVRQITGTVEIAGTDRTSQVTSVTVDREIATTLPTTAAAGGGLSKATGSIDLTDPGVVITQSRNSPWARSSGWPPARADTVVVDASVNDEVSTRRFTGRISAVNGSATDTTKVDIEDATDNLKVDFSHDAMLRTMPPPGNNTDTMLQVGLRADWIADKVMRQAGFYTTPRVIGTGVVAVTAQGSMWPSIGTCRACTNTAGNSQPNFTRAEWGLAVTDVQASYEPREMGSNDNLRGRVVAQGMMIGLEHAAWARMDTLLGAAAVTTRVSPTRQVELRFNGTVLGTYTPTGDWTRVETIWRADGTIRVHTDTGWSRDLTWTPSTAALDGAVGRTDISVNAGGRAAGFIVQFAPTTYSGGYTGQELTATIVPGPLLSAGMRAMPSLTSRDGLDLLTEISQATVTSMWIDRDGHLWWVHPDRLRDQEPALTLTATADLLDLAWKDTADSARRSVTVTYDEPTIRRKLQYRLKAWEGSGDNLKQGESTEEVISPPSDQDWVEVDEPTGGGAAIYATPYPSNPQELPDFNRGVGSWFGGTHLDANGDSPQTKLADWDSADGTPPWIEDHNDDFPNLIRSLTKIGPAAWKLSVGLQDTASNYWPDFQQQLDPVHDGEAGVAGAGSDINMSWTGQKLPIIRCKAITEWTESSATSSVTGPVGYQDLNHESGPWVGDGASALADWIAEQVTHPTPILDGFPINYRSDVHLGMVIDIVEDAVYNIQIRALVIGIKESHELANSALDLTCRVISVERLMWTYDEMSRYWDIKGGDYDALAATGQTYDATAVPPADLADVLATPLVEPLPLAPIREWPDDTEVGS